MLRRLGFSGRGLVAFLPFEHRVLARATRTIGADLVDQSVCRDGDQPAARVIRNAVGRPLVGRGQQRLLDGVLARVELSVAPNERAEDLRRPAAQQALDVLCARRGHMSCPPPAFMIARTSIAANRALGHRDAISVARSGVSQSTIR